MRTEFARLKRRAVVGLALGGALLAWACAGRAAPEKPNIIVFLVDDMSLMDTSVPMLADDDGRPQRHPLNDWYRTPNMERLAATGIRFSNFYSHSVCSPTRISIMTGQNAARHRTTDYINPWQDNRTLDNQAFPLAVSQRGPPEWELGRPEEA